MCNVRRIKGKEWWNEESKQHTRTTAPYRGEKRSGGRSVYEERSGSE